MSPTLVASALALVLSLAPSLALATRAGAQEARRDTTDTRADTTAERSRRDRPRRRADMLRAEEFAGRSWSSLYELVSTLRANWLHLRGPDTINGDQLDVKVLFDGMPLGGVDQLRAQPVTGVVYLQRFDPVAASARWGFGYGKGAIFVSTRADSRD